MSSSTVRQQIGFVFKAVQVRLRFFLLLLVAFVVVGQWDRIRTGWDRITGLMWGHSHAGQSISSDVEFFCPMDPGVVNSWPSICPVCNMVLVRRKKGDMAALPDGVVARMQFSPYRVQLAGIQTTALQEKTPELELSGASELQTTDPPAADKLKIAVELPRRATQFDLSKQVAQVTTGEVPGIEPCSAKVLSQTGSQVVLEVDNKHHWLQSGMWATARFRIPFRDLEPFRSSPKIPEKVLTVPESSVVDFGSQQIVYVESHPGTFDGRAVTLGPRCGDEYPVVAGLAAGQRIATSGAFLIDAEARLNPSAAASYFGAAGAVTPTTPDTAPPSSPSAAETSATASKLSKADQNLARQQKICPVTNAPLDSMGGPVPVVVQGRKVFICCEACEDKLKETPAKYLAKIPLKKK